MHPESHHAYLRNRERTYLLSKGECGLGGTMFVPLEFHPVSYQRTLCAAAAGQNLSGTSRQREALGIPASRIFQAIPFPEYRDSCFLPCTSGPGAYRRLLCQKMQPVT